MIQILNHPNQLDTLLNFISGHVSTETDFLCVVCYEELKQACDFKKKCIESTMYKLEKPPSEVEVRKISECDSSFTSMSEFLGANSFAASVSQVEDDETEKNPVDKNIIFLNEEDDEIKEIQVDENTIIIDTSDEESAEPTSSKKTKPNPAKKAKRLIYSDLFFSVSDNMCEFCFQKFDSKEITDDHKKSHQSETHPYICPYANCKKKFQKRYHLQSHYVAHLTSYKCSFCEKTYKYKLLLENHEKLHHQNQNDNADTASESSTSSKRSRKYPCKVCGRAFGAKANLVFHAKYQHDKNWSAKEFECILCDEVFMQSEKLAGHLKKIHKCS